MFEKIVEIPTVEGRTAGFRKLTKLIKSEFAKAGISNVVIKDHDDTQTLIVRWPAAKPSGGHARNALPQRAEANVNCRIFPGVTAEQVRSTLAQLAGENVAVSLGQHSQASPPSPVRADVTDAFRAALATRFKDVTVIPYMSAGATEGSYLRNAGLPVYGFGGLWSIIGQKSGVHGLDERVLIDGFHGQVPIWEAMIRRVAG